MTKLLITLGSPPFQFLHRVCRATKGCNPTARVRDLQVIQYTPINQPVLCSRVKKARTAFTVQTPSDVLIGRSVHYSSRVHIYLKFLNKYSVDVCTS